MDACSSGQLLWLASGTKWDFWWISALFDMIYGKRKGCFTEAAVKIWPGCRIVLKRGDFIEIDRLSCRPGQMSEEKFTAK